MASYRFLTGFVAVTALTSLIHCSNKSSMKDSSDKGCSERQALQTKGIHGSSIPPKTIALTFDDGPGPRTKQLSTFLKSQGIQAAFFVNGKSMDQSAPEILQQLANDGHLVANHTETHRSLTGTSTSTVRLSDPEIVAEVSDTDAKIEPFVPSKRFLFRPPFGDFDDAAFDVLAGTPMSKYVGPILWDIGDKMDEAHQRAADWECWQDGADAKRIPMQACGDMYITEIKRQGRGIVLMHDPYFNEQDPEQRGTVDMVMYMVPILKEAGFGFVRVDTIPDIAALLPPLEGAGAGSLQTVAPGQGNADDPCR